MVRFDVMVSEGNRLASFERDAEANSRYEHGVTLYRGDLATRTNIYAVIEREELRVSFLTIVVWLAERS